MTPDPSRSIMRRPTTPLVIAAVALVAAGGYIHLREWLDIYRHIPASFPGATVVRVGFPINAAISVLLAVALVITMFARRGLALVVVGVTFAFQVASLGSLIVSRKGHLFGWMETGWSGGANQARAVELGALVVLAGVAALHGAEARSPASSALRRPAAS